MKNYQTERLTSDIPNGSISRIVLKSCSLRSKRIRHACSQGNQRDPCHADVKPDDATQKFGELKRKRSAEKFLVCFIKTLISRLNTRNLRATSHLISE